MQGWSMFDSLFLSDNNIYGFPEILLVWPPQESSVWPHRPLSLP